MELEKVKETGESMVKSGADAENLTSAQVWEERYAQERVWSGRPNHALVTYAGDLAPATALELGCGEGADAIWLAERGWRVTGVDVSPTALARAADHARERGVTVTWVEVDLAEWHTTEIYDLVTAFFLHSPVNFPRAQILSRAAQAVAPGGVLLIVGHANFPPWSRHHHDEADPHSRPTFPTIDETIQEAGIDHGWEILAAETAPREVTGPDGQSATIHDTVVKARRRPAC